MKKISLNIHIKQFVDAYPIYIIVFCIHIPAAIYEIYSAYYDRYGIVPAIQIFLVVCLFLFAVSRLILRDTQLAGLSTLTGLMLLFPKSALAVPIYPLISIAGLGLVAVHFWRRKERSGREAIRLPANFTSIANVVAVAMVVALGARTIFYEYRITGQASTIAMAAYAAIGRTTPTRAPASLPNIVHIVLDGYSRADVLQSAYGFDNTPFLTALRQRGFRVADKATTPFNQTLLVMGSIFSLGAINESVNHYMLKNDKSTLRRILARSQEHGVVSTILSDLGYELQSAPSIYLPLQWDRIVGADGHASVMNHLSVPETYIFVYDLLQSSPVFGRLVEPLLSDSFNIVAIDYRNLKDVPKRRFQMRGNRPQFIYQHILAPHPPFNITAGGKPKPLAGFPRALDDGSHLIEGNDAKRTRYRDGYIEKLQYINGAILEQIDGLKVSLPGPLIIILHGDHGGGLHFDQDEKTNTCLNERFSPLLAVFATEGTIADEFTDDFNLVNIYRAIFRAMLDADLPNLPNRSVFVPWALDKATEISSTELALTCADPTRKWTADRTPSSPPSLPTKSIAR